MTRGIGGWFNLSPFAADAVWADRRSTSAQVKPVVRMPESTATVTYLGRFT